MSSSSIFEKGRLKPGVYKIQNLFSETYLDIHQHSKQVCCRPAEDLADGAGLKWKIESLGAGYTVQRIEPGKPGRFCTPMNGLNDGVALFVNAYPAAWRIEVVDRELYRGDEYVRFYWGPTKKTWDLAGGYRIDGTKVQFYDVREEGHNWQIWKLIPMNAQPTSTLSQPSSGTTGLGSPPLHDGDLAEQPSARTQHNADSERDDFGTIITEVITKTTTTRKRYRVEEP